ncbi:aldolase/citrate lyase family protein [Alicyclobacillus sp.]|uniref:HpcH/HpaI aldolase family protein n=1 Tax=Alicyclobacillus sp. TaxID=61169 RepID=UPI0025C53057|nr:aldolase/citrate lyase family protein [Alicyclobacillus sp.]MCL6516073.1 aldolase [Alicyclobacillus sp.]
MRNTFKRKLLDPTADPPLSIFIGVPSAALVEMAAYAGFDAVVLDNEHGTFTHEQIEMLCAVAENAGVTPMVRVVSGERTEILKALDRGAHGLHVPQVNSPEEALAVVEAAKYPPLGKRGAAFSIRAARFGAIAVDRYLEEANRETCIAVHIETRRALERIDEILSVPGLDVAYIGPTDLSVSLGCAGQPDAPPVREAIDEILNAGRRHGVRVGIHVPNPHAARDRLRWGADYVGTTWSALIAGAFSGYVRGVREGGG